MLGGLILEGAGLAAVLACGEDDVGGGLIATTARPSALLPLVPPANARHGAGVGVADLRLHDRAPAARGERARLHLIR